MNFTKFVQKECPESIVAQLPYGLTMNDLEAELGTDPDWSKIKADPYLLQGYAKTIATTRQVRAGQVPNEWTGVFQCATCGPVYLESGGPKDLLACPWCQNRIQGLPIPRPAITPKREDARTVGHLSPEERYQWCLAHELTQSENCCPNKTDLTRCVLWRAIKERWPVSRLTTTNKA